MGTSVAAIKGQIVVTAKIRRKLGIKKGAKIVLIKQGGKLVIQPTGKSYFESLAGVLGTNGKLLKSLLKARNRDRNYESSRSG